MSRKVRTLYRNLSQFRLRIALGALVAVFLLAVLHPHVTKADETPPPQPGQIRFETSAYSVNEWQSEISVAVTRVNGKDGPVTVDYATADGTATAGSDYTAAFGTVSFADQDDQTKYISVPILDDSTNEPDETFTVTLSNPTGGATLTSPYVSTVTILDNERVDCDGDTVNNPID